MESSIKFNVKFCNPIEDKGKTSAIRLTDKGLKIGDKFKAVFVKDNGEIYSDISAFRPLTMEVTKMLQTQVKYLSSYDAYLDGFNDVNELFDDLTKYYPDLRLNDTVYIIHFKKVE